MEEFEQYTSVVVKHILQAIVKPNMKIQDQSSILEVVGDLISGVPEKCKEVIPMTMNILSEIAKVPMEDDEEVMNAVCQLRQSGMYVYSIIFQSYPIPNIVEFVKFPITVDFPDNHG